MEYGRASNGKRLQASKAGYPTRAAAQTALLEAVQTFRADVSVHTMTVEQYLRFWLDSKLALKPKTADLYEGLCRNYLLPHLGHVPLLQLRAPHLEVMYRRITVGARGRPLSPATIRRIHGVLRSALNTAVKRQLIPYNPADHIELAPETHRRPRPWTPQQCQSFLIAAAADRLHDLYQLLLVTGMRRGEAIGLRWEDVDLDGRCLFVVQQITEVNGKLLLGAPKTKRGTRLVPIDDHTVAMLRRHKEGQAVERLAWGPAWNDEGLVFTREDGSAVRPGFATRHFRDLTQQAGLPQIRLHDLRHTNATLALMGGVDLKVVSERLGHSQLAITADLYTHVNRGLGQDAADRIGRILQTDGVTFPGAALAQPAPRPDETAAPEASGGPKQGIRAGQRSVDGSPTQSRRGDLNP